MAKSKTLAIAWIFAALGSAASCADGSRSGQPSSSTPFAVPAARALRAAATSVTPLGPAWRPEQSPAGPPREAGVETPSGRFSASVETKRAGQESTASRIVLRAHARESGATVRERTIDKDVVNLFDIAWAPDGSMLAFCEGTLVSAVGWSGDPQVLYAGPGGPYPGACTGLAWSADGRRLQFIQLEHAADPSLANPAKVTLELEPDSNPVENGAQR